MSNTLAMDRLIFDLWFHSNLEKECYEGCNPHTIISLLLRYINNKSVDTAVFESLKFTKKDIRIRSKRIKEQNEWLIKKGYMKP